MLHETGLYLPKGAEPPLDAAIAALAERQHGVVALFQLVALGLSADAVRKRATRGRLHRVHRGVYAVGWPGLTRHGRWMAAVLACGPDAVLSHGSAAALWNLVRPRASRPHVITPGRAPRRRADITVHGSLTLSPDDVTVHDGIPCTTVARTLLDLPRPGRALEEAERLGLFDLRTTEETMARAPGHPGRSRLHAALRAWRPPPLTRSEAERKLLAIIRAARLPEPACNVWVGSHEVDMLWADRDLAVEFDSYEFHDTRGAFERDRLRDARLGDLDIRVIAVTPAQLAEPERELLPRLRRRLSRGGAGG